jgi:drug/metabolite transporter (DMT)-like permease
VVLFLLSIILTAVFYNKLPSEVYYHFSGDIPDREVSRTAIIAWLLIPQFVLMVIGVAISGIGSIVSRKYKISNINNTKRLLMAMGNMVALPQIILIFTLLDIFLYNAYDIRLIPLWIIIVIVLLIGTIVLGIFFYRIIRQFHTSKVKQNQE